MGVCRCWDQKLGLPVLRGCSESSPFGHGLSTLKIWSKSIHYFWNYLVCIWTERGEGEYDKAQLFLLLKEINTMLLQCGSMGELLWCWTWDQQVVSSNPSCPAVVCNPRQVVNTHVPLSPSSIIWHQPMGSDTLQLGS